MASKTISKEIKNTSSKSQTVALKTVNGSSNNGHSENLVSSNKKAEMSESDKLTLRAWKRTFENHHKTKV
jgi:hypothetical protein